MNNYNFTDLLYWCFIAVNDHGYYTADNALIYNTKPTAERVTSLVSGVIDKSAEEYDDAAKMTKWLLTAEESPFMNKIKKLINDGVTIKDSSILASQISPYYTYLYNEIRRKRLNAMAFTDAYVLDTMKRLKVDVTFLNFMKPTYANSRAKTFNFKTDEGHRLEWTGVMSNGQVLKPNQRYRLNGITKAHKERDNVKTTVMTKCKLNKI